MNKGTQKKTFAILREVLSFIQDNGPSTVLEVGRNFVPTGMKGKIAKDWARYKVQLLKKKKYVAEYKPRNKKNTTDMAYRYCLTAKGREWLTEEK